jgi:hypothetical protein
VCRTCLLSSYMTCADVLKTFCGVCVDGSGGVRVRGGGGVKNCC